MIAAINILLMIFTFGMYQAYDITYYDMTLDTPIVELNDKSLKEVFENGIININSDFNNVSGWNPYGGIYTVSDGIAIFTANGTQPFTSLHQDITIDGHVYYHNAYIRVLNTNAKRISILISSSITKLIENPVYNEWYYLSAKNIAGSNLRFQTIVNYENALIANGNQHELDYYKLYDMTLLGISSLTVEEMDYYFTLYQDIKENGSIHEMTYTENTFDIHDLTIIILSFAVWYFSIKIIKEVF